MSKHIVASNPILPQQSIAEGSPAAKVVHKYIFRIPDSARDPARDPAYIELQELSSAAFLTAAKLAKGVRDQINTEAAKLSLYSVDGRPVDHGSAEADAYWAKWSAKVRTLVHIGFAKIHSTTDEEDKDFLDSMEIRA